MFAGALVDDLLALVDQVMFDANRCEFSSDDYGNVCGRPAVVSDLESEALLCATHGKGLVR